MERPDWIDAALKRGRGGLARVRDLAGPSSGGDGAEEKPAPETKEVEKKPDAKSEANEPKQEAEREGTPIGERVTVAWDRVRERPMLAVGCVALALLVIVWVAWTIHVGSTNGGSAAVGVLITWPLFCLIVANLVLIGIGLTMLFRYLQPSGAVAGGGEAPGAAVASPKEEKEEKAKDAGKDEKKNETKADS